MQTELFACDTTDYEHVHRNKGWAMCALRKKPNQTVIISDYRNCGVFISIARGVESLLPKASHSKESWRIVHRLRVEAARRELQRSRNVNEPYPRSAAHHRRGLEWRVESVAIVDYRRRGICKDLMQTKGKSSLVGGITNSKEKKRGVAAARPHLNRWKE